jgi:hypothetical protein
LSSLISCPGCTHKLTLPEDFIGQRVQCPKCLIEFHGQATATPAMEVDPQAQPVVAPPEVSIPQAQAAPPLQTGYAPVAKMVTLAPAPAGVPSLYCVECGTKYQRTDDACPSCGYRNYELLAERLGERRRARPRDLPPLRSGLAIWGAILLPLGVAVFFAGPIVSDGFRRPGSPPFVLGFFLSSVGGLLEMIALVCCATWLFQAWRVVSHGDEEYSPGLMVGLLFVPFFNLYWLFRAIPGLSSALERELKYIAPARPSAAGWVPGLIACILLLIPYFQPVAVCMFLAWMLIANNAARRLVRLHEQASREQADPADKRDR